MPYSIETDDGIVIDGIPDNIPPDSRILKDRVAAIRAERGMKPPAGAASTAAPAVEDAGLTSQAALLRRAAQEAPPAAAPEKPPAPETTTDGVVSAALRGVAPVATGAALGAAMGAPFAGVGAIPGAAVGAGMVLGGDLTVGLVNSVLGSNFTSPTEAVQGLLTKLGVEKPDTQAEKIVQAVSEGAASALSGVGLASTVARAAPAGSAVARYATGMASGAGTQAMMNATAGAGSEYAGQVAQEYGAGTTMETLARLGGAFGGAAAGASAFRNTIGGTLTSAPRSPERLRQAAEIAAAERAGIPVMTSDIARPNTFTQKLVQGLGEKVPVVGTGPVRAAQQGKRVDAVKEFLQEYGAGDFSDNAEKVARDLVATRNVKLGGLLADKANVMRLVDSRAGAVDVSGTQAAIKQQIDKLDGFAGPEVKAVQDYLREVSGKLAGNSLSDLELQRKALSDKFTPSENTEVKTLAQKAYNSIYGALRRDMTNHAAANVSPAELARYQKADATLHEMMNDLDNFKQLEAALKKGDVRLDSVTNMIRNSDRNVVRKLYNDLSAQGQASMRAAIVSDVAEKAGGLDHVSPEKFLSAVQKSAKQFGVTFDRENMGRLRDLQRALKVTARASQAAVTPATGVQGVPFLAGGALVGLLGTKGAGAVALTAGGLARAFESAPVRDLLVRFPTVRPGSKQEYELAKQIVVAMEQAAADDEPISVSD